MARYTGPKTKIARKFKEPIYGADKYFEKKNYPPGQHGLNKRRSKLSEYGLQLLEKQKTKYTYGILERQFKKTFKKAQSKKGVTGDNLMKFLESRIDNVVYRLGIAPTRAAARQLVTHRHILLNGKICNIPSAMLVPGDIVAVRERSKVLEVITNSLSGKSNPYSWLEWDSALMSGKFMNYPEREEIPENINEQAIVELYSK
ncbi:MAG TPA: 30S ribosomal protein S4 [Bacteroidales bacterium]|jgi:small subunit ribosomal protein S4|nr:30S ribosomal protein S4 [Bacteroidales bacterium]HOF45163.1 30S ribosomal protein S4 [Bacteroidales bacterium]HOS57455.1 30S ribosomal protein S4 [Bacteroidales bacterium]HPY80502.1 30S ribosomal protein S4 [Bacteroidales bacterium]HQA86076.1 30S ribosomal protein S4 [Bacteroidales bacterium]